MTDEPVIILDRKQLLACLNENGFPIKASYLQQICLPSRAGRGPPVALRLGYRVFYEQTAALKWAAARAAVTRRNRAKVVYCARCARRMKRLRGNEHAKSLMTYWLGIPILACRLGGNRSWEYRSPTIEQTVSEYLENESGAPGTSLTWRNANFDERRAGEQPMTCF